MHTHPLKVAAAVKLALATACLYAPVTQADNTLAPVEVTGSRTASVARELPTGTLILDRDTIEAMPANNLADVLDTLGGVQVRRNFGINGARATIDMQGFGANATSNTLVLLNGRRYSNVDLSGPDIASIPLAAIERIEVLPGAGAALYGNGVVGGAVNIVTRERYRNQAGVEVTGGSFSTTGGGLWATGHHQDEGGGDNHTSAAAAREELPGDAACGQALGKPAFTAHRSEGEYVHTLGQEPSCQLEEHDLGTPGAVGLDGKCDLHTQLTPVAEPARMTMDRYLTSDRCAG